VPNLTNSRPFIKISIISYYLCSAEYSRIEHKVAPENELFDCAPFNVPSPPNLAMISPLWHVLLLGGLDQLCGSSTQPNRLGWWIHSVPAGADASVNFEKIMIFGNAFGNLSLLSKFF
jgi:hypothetical protein